MGCGDSRLERGDSVLARHIHDGRTRLPGLTTRPQSSSADPKQSSIFHFSDTTMLTEETNPAQPAQPQ
ncbi:hypothetical protein Pyn_25308 [Prunus yedoensis var. nudiflora]|uniref:Uncharacterized protein n=1 Tax=Prunus yedoensis var. nudiflora TaxID=2094558 RepID=A0A314YPS5_PRUYE|nr:hypothetical protein Pyn_25308 [Prunus yedoensis var. nudiflora]